MEGRVNIRIDGDVRAWLEEMALPHREKVTDVARRIIMKAFNESHEKGKGGAVQYSAPVDVPAARSGGKNKGRRCHEGDALHCPVKRSKAS
jgi:hypothetical protein